MSWSSSKLEWWAFGPTLAMLYLTHDIQHRYFPCYTWHMIYNTGTWHVILDTCYLTHVLPGIFMIMMLPDIWYSCTPEILYSWTPVSPVLMSPALLLLFIAQSDRRPTKHAWCQDDEDVSYNHASVRRILNGTKCHTEQSATPVSYTHLTLPTIYSV